jgi:hypothetical protein
LGYIIVRTAEFDAIFAVAITLGIRNKKKKAEKVKSILD